MTQKRKTKPAEKKEPAFGGISKASEVKRVVGHFPGRKKNGAFV